MNSPYLWILRRQWKMFAKSHFPFQVMEGLKTACVIIDITWTCKMNDDYFSKCIEYLQQRQLTESKWKGYNHWNSLAVIKEQRSVYVEAGRDGKTWFMLAQWSVHGLIWNLTVCLRDTAPYLKILKKKVIFNHKQFESQERKIAKP